MNTLVERKDNIFKFYGIVKKYYLQRAKTFGKKGIVSPMVLDQQQLNPVIIKQKIFPGKYVAF